MQGNKQKLLQLSSLPNRTVERIIEIGEKTPSMSSCLLLITQLCEELLRLECWRSSWRKISDVQSLGLCFNILNVTRFYEEAQTEQNRGPVSKYTKYSPVCVGSSAFVCSHILIELWAACQANEAKWTPTDQNQMCVSPLTRGQISGWDFNGLTELCFRC